MILLVAGTRPEIIKLAPVYRQMKKRGMEPRWLFTGQHTDIGLATFQALGLEPEYQYQLDRQAGDLTELMALLANALQEALRDLQPQLVLVQGDTLTTLAGAQQAFLAKIPVGHVEAGLRSWDLKSPFPEEACRVMVDTIADLKFAPTKQASMTVTGQVWVTGQTEIDAARMIEDRRIRPAGERYVVATTHRRENMDELLQIASGIAMVANSGTVDKVIWPVHPGVAKHAEMAVKYVPNVELTDPLPYDEMVNLVRYASLVMTDSGGLQELSVALGVPVLVLRQETERPEGIDAGGARLVGTDPKKIAGWAAWLLQDPEEWKQMANARNPYGDGCAAERIMMICKAYLEGRTVNDRIANWAGAA